MLSKLEQIDKKLFKYVQSNIEVVYSKLDNIESTFKEYTDHSTKHSERIIQIAKLLNGENDLNKFELALFILSAYYHDIGMYVSKEEYIHINTQIKKLPEYPKLKESIYNDEKLVDRNKTDFFLTLDYLRANHGIRTNYLIDKMFPKTNKLSFYSSEFYFWEHVKNICLSHTLNFEQLLSSPYNPKISIGNNNLINLTYLSVLLRLADICHFSKDRALPYFRITKEFFSRKSESIWKYYGDITDTRPDSETLTINIYATCSNFYNHRSIIAHSNNIQKELMNCHKIIVESNSKYSLPWKYVNTKNVISDSDCNYQYFETHFKLNYRKITSLLMGDRLYRNKLFAIREVLQNAIDSTFVFNKKIPNNDNYVHINYIQNDTDTILDIFDSGTGMDKEIINKYFLSIGEDSFWYTQRCVKDWGDFKKHDQLIADHGIGVLSYFMLSDKIEIFSIYHIDGEYNHVLIDNYESDIIFLNTSIKLFPKFKETPPLSTPWDLRHGTCIRFHLKNGISKKSLLEFLSKHIIRIPCNLYFNYNDFTTKLSNIWHFREKIDNHCYGREAFFDDEKIIEKDKEENFEEFYKKLYIPQSGFYDNPPRDSSIEKNFFSDDNRLFFKININYSDSSSEPCRISQNGILIEDAIDFIINKHNPDSLFITAYGFDMNVTGEFQFQLDAERTRIINSDYNSSIFEKIVDILDMHYFVLLSQIESTTYFPCGGNFYHSIKDIIFPHRDLVIYFHENLSRTFEVKNIEVLKNKYSLTKLNSAKIYNIGCAKNESISINDIKARKLSEIFILKEYLSEKRIKGSRRYHEKNLVKEEKSVINELETMKNADSLICIPLQNKGFIIPLIINFDFEVFQNTKCFKKIKIVEFNNQPLEEKINIFGIK